jgi:hypothetical protein
MLRRFTGHHSEEMTDRYDVGTEIDFQQARERPEELLCSSSPSMKAARKMRQARE